MTISARCKALRRATRYVPVHLEGLENRVVLSVSVLNNAGNGIIGLSFNQSSGGYVPPDTCGAAGPSVYVETVNQTLAIYNKSTGAGNASASLSSFLFTTGGLSRADSGSGQSDPVVTYDEKIGRFIVGDQDVNFNTHVSAFDLAVSKSNNPTTLSTADWTFYKITTTESGFDADYPGNVGYNADAFVFTLNMFGVVSGGHAQIVAVKASDLANGASSPQVAQNDLANFSIRPTTMHDSVAGDPMWFSTEHGDNTSVDVIKMTNVLTTSPTFTSTNIPVTAYSAVVNPLNPNGAAITTNIDSRIQKASESNNTLVFAHAVAKSSTQDVIQWYAVNVGGATPTLAQQGRVDAGNNTYLTYPGIDINASGDIGMSYIRSGNDTSTDYMSMWVTGRVSADTAGTTETPAPVPNATGQGNYTDFTASHRAGDLSGINLDPTDGSFWAANEYANTQATANWGTGIANFRLAAPANAADLSVTNTGPTSVTAGINATYTVTAGNSGPNAATGFVLTNVLPAGSVLVSVTQTAGTDAFTFAQSGGTVTESANAAMASGSSDTFSVVVSAPSSLTAGSAFSDTASVRSDGSTTDPNTANNSATVTGSIAGASTDLAVTDTSDVTTANEGDPIGYTVTVTNNGSNPGTGVVLTDTLGANLNFVSATTTQGTFTRSGSVLTFNVGTVAVGTSITIKVTAQAAEDGALSNSASLTATSGDPNTANNSATATTTVNEPPINVSAPITTSSAKLAGVSVATFTHANGLEAANAFKATINWGDGTTSAGTITLSGTTYTVTGSHRYSSRGTLHTITTTVTEVGQATQLLLAKIGDEVPDLPARFIDTFEFKHFSLNGATNDLARNVESYLSNLAGPPVTLDSLRAGLVALHQRGKAEGRTPPLATLTSSLRYRVNLNPKLVDVLLLIDEIAADEG